VLSLAAIQRVFAAIQYASGNHPPWPIEVQITLLIGGSSSLALRCWSVR